MLKKNFDYELNFYFFEVVDPNEPPNQWKSHKDDDGIIMMWKTESGKYGLRSHQAYNPKEERFLTTSEYWRRSDKRIKDELGEPMLVPIWSTEWEEFQEWKRSK